MKPASPATPSPLTRHTFLQQSAVDAGGLARPPIIPASAPAAAGAVPPSARTPIGLIGKGVRANGHLKFLAHRDAVELVAVCAVDRLRRKAGCAEIAEINAGKKSVGSCQSCTADHDYREFLARPAIDAAQVGQDIDGDQPVAMTIQVGRRIAETVRRSGRVFPTGTPDRSIPDVPRVGQFVGDGCLGQVKSVSPLQNHPSLHRRSMLQIRRWRRGGRPRRNQHFCRPPQALAAFAPDAPAGLPPALADANLVWAARLVAAAQRSAAPPLIQLLSASSQPKHIRPAAPRALNPASR